MMEAGLDVIATPGFGTCKETGTLVRTRIVAPDPEVALTSIPKLWGTTSRPTVTVTVIFCELPEPLAVTVTVEVLRVATGTPVPEKPTGFNTTPLRLIEP